MTRRAAVAVDRREPDRSSVACCWRVQPSIGPLTLSTHLGARPVVVGRGRLSLDGWPGQPLPSPRLPGQALASCRRALGRPPCHPPQRTARWLVAGLCTAGRAGPAKPSHLDKATRPGYLGSYYRTTMPSRWIVVSRDLSKGRRRCPHCGSVQWLYLGGDVDRCRPEAPSCAASGGQPRHKGRQHGA